MSRLTEALARIWSKLAGADLTWVAFALILYCLAWAAASGRWRLIVQSLGGRLGWGAALLATIAGVCINNITPTGRLGGEACRIAITRLRGQLSLTRGALATVADRVTDIPPILVLLLFALPVLPRVTGGYDRAIAIGAVVFVLALAAGVPWFQQLARTSWTWWDREGVVLRPRTITGAFAFAAAMWIEDLFRLIAVGLAFDVGLSFPQAAALVVVGVLGGFVPTVGGLGAVEGALVGTLLLFQVPLETAVAMTALERSITYGFSTIVGGLVVITSGGRRLWTGKDPSGPPSPPARER